MLDKFNTPYNSKEIEDRIYRLWEKSGYFNPDKLPGKRKKPFTIIMPPPNANGSLHIGHAVFVTLQDIMIRYRRMKGDKTLWLPGADHAGFETQVVYDKKLEKEGRNRFHIPKDQLYSEILEFTMKNKAVMENQLKKLGASCDWSREKFTLDDDVRKVVYSTFQKLYKDGLVYRDSRIVNWCTKHQTTLSDLEVKYIERKDPLYYMKYGPLTLATVRLETKFGDTAVAVNPKDARYKNFIGKEIEIETVVGSAKIRVIADEAVDRNFGTGVVKVTPAHDPNDFEMWQRHKDEMSEPWAVIDQYGRMDLLSRWPDNEQVKRYNGIKVLEARKIIEEDMVKAGLIVKIDTEYTHTVATCYKCGTILEPRIMPQWFVAMTKKTSRGKKSLRDLAVEAVKTKKVIFVTKRFEKIFMHWMKNLRDWNISRQIAWGIQIPVWYKGEEVYIGEKAPKTGDWKQETDVFDTWFSSGQWPFATLMTTKKNDFKTFYPTNVMETGWDILFFWVARMIMLGLYTAGKPPFKYVYLHGLVRDKERQKMSKSKGNVIDPLGVIDIYGTDALRMSLIIGNTPGNDPIIYEEKIRGYRNFSNKIWQASRFVLMNCKDEHFNAKPRFTTTDRKKINELNRLVKEISKSMDSFQFYAAAEKIYHYFWHMFADQIIEETKQRLRGENEKEKSSAQYLLAYTLQVTLKLLHPFMPFITEEIYSSLPIKNKKLLIVEKWPK